MSRPSRSPHTPDRRGSGTSEEHDGPSSAPEGPQRSVDANPDSALILGWIAEYFCGRVESCYTLLQSVALAAPLSTLVPPDRSHKLVLAALKHAALTERESGLEACVVLLDDLGERLPSVVLETPEQYFEVLLDLKTEATMAVMKRQPFDFNACLLALNRFMPQLLHLAVRGWMADLAQLPRDTQGRLLPHSLASPFRHTEGAGHKSSGADGAEAESRMRFTSALRHCTSTQNLLRRRLMNVFASPGQRSAILHRHTKSGLLAACWKKLLAYLRAFEQRLEPDMIVKIAEEYRFSEQPGHSAMSGLDPAMAANSTEQKPGADAHAAPFSASFSPSSAAKTHSPLGQNSDSNEAFEPDVDFMSSQQLLFLSSPSQSRTQGHGRSGSSASDGISGAIWFGSPQAAARSPTERTRDERALLSLAAVLSPETKTAMRVSPRSSGEFRSKRKLVLPDLDPSPLDANATHQSKRIAEEPASHGE